MTANDLWLVLSSLQQQSVRHVVRNVYREIQWHESCFFSSAGSRLPSLFIASSVYQMREYLACYRKRRGKEKMRKFPLRVLSRLCHQRLNNRRVYPLSLPVLLSFYYYDFFLDVIIIQYFSPLRLARWGDVMEISTTTRIRTKRGKRNHHPRNLLLPSLLLLLCLSKRRPERGNALSTSGRGVVLKKTGGCGRRRVVVRRQKQGGKRRKKKMNKRVKRAETPLWSLRLSTGQ